MPGRSVKPCLCQRRNIVRASLAVPPKFGNPKLNRLTAQPWAHESQAAVIEYLKAHPRESYLFCGRNGSGKTHFCWALLRAALCSRRRVRAALLSELIDQYREWEFSKEGRPTVLPAQLKSSEPYTVFLDEFDKANATEYASRKLFELLNAARDYEQQLLIATNKTWEELQQRWSKIDPVYGDSIMKRVEECRVIEMF